MLAVGQPRVSQLVKEGALVADKDDDGRMQFDRASVEAYAASRARLRAKTAEEREERSALHAEARDRMAAERKRRQREQEERTAREESRRERIAAALEGIHECLRQPRRS